ncbi:MULTISPECIES: hypothetical protein [unclassified Streptomyces]|uniref:hypothetical protein n=1 Tax=unclassified Streptomyces TaxID=2593676 RepID=UPI000959FE93|nr:hypothetical protein [Streptomyces sp. TSRI0107]OKJ84053.1 hypothetical protein AMK31_18205 [Streptomyces sp. TSRI0107]
MTPSTAERPQMPIEDFEDLVDVAPDGVRLEFVNGRVRTKDVVYTDPKDGRYQQSHRYAWGATVDLPAPVGITLDTEKLKDYAD